MKSPVFSIGDKVKIKPHRIGKCNQYCGYFAEEMEIFVDAEMVIKELKLAITGNYYNLKDNTYNWSPCMLEKVEENICKHCGGDVGIRNPSGYCDHLCYPENCDICSGKKVEGQKGIEKLHLTKTDFVDAEELWLGSNVDLVKTINKLIEQGEKLTADIVEIKKEMETDGESFYCALCKEEISTQTRDEHTSSVHLPKKECPKSPTGKHEWGVNTCMYCDESFFAPEPKKEVEGEWGSAAGGPGSLGAGGKSIADEVTHDRVVEEEPKKVKCNHTSKHGRHFIKDEEDFNFCPMCGESFL